MNAKMTRFLELGVLCGALVGLNGCGSSPPGCPTCGTEQNAGIGLIDVMYVPEHNPQGLPGGPFNLFDIGFADPVNGLYTITDRLGVDVPVFSMSSNVALWAIGGDNSIAENGNDASRCWQNSTATQFIPPTVSAQGNYQRFGCKSLGFFVPGLPGSPNPPNPNTPPHFGGFSGGQCCSARASNLNPLTGPNGIEVTADGNFEVVGNGSSELFVFDLRPMLSSGFSAAPLVTAVIPTGSSPDFDGPLGIAACMESAQGRAFTDPTCGDLRADELATTGAVVGPFADEKNHFLVGIINGDPGLPFFSVIDLTQVVAPTPGATGITALQQHCLPFNPALPFSPGGPVNLAQTPPNPANYSTCILGQIYYDGAGQNDTTTLIDNTGSNSLPCPDPTVQFYGTTVSASGVSVNTAGVFVPSGASGPAAGGASANPAIACHHGPMLTNTSPTQAGGVYCQSQGTAAGAPATANCSGSVGPAGLGGLIYYPPTKMFLLTNGNSIGDITVGSVDVIDPIHPVTGGFAPVVVNSFPIYNCMPTGLSQGPGTDVLVSCANHDGRAFAPSAVIIDGTTGQVLTTINNIGYSDQTWYNPGDNNYYLAAGAFPTGPVLGVINAGTRQWLQNVPTQGNAHSVAADPLSKHIFVPLAPGPLCLGQSGVGCIGVYGAQ
jgi:hypothetical protein